MAGVIVLVLLIAGCASARSQPGTVSGKTVAQAATPQPGGLRDAGFVYDGPADALEASSALQAAQKALPALAAPFYVVPDARPVGWPPTAGSLAHECTLAVVPVYERVGSPKTVASLFSVTRPAPGQYLLVMLRRSSIFSAWDWARSPDRAGWKSPHGLVLQFAEPQDHLRRFFGPGSIAIRIVSAPRGYWVIGDQAGQERGWFMPYEQSAPGGPDAPDTPPLYTTSEMLAYGASPGDN